jgi:hypothetical protein
MLQQAEQASGRYEFTVDLMRLWIEESKSTGIVADELR